MYVCSRSVPDLEVWGEGVQVGHQSSVGHSKLHQVTAACLWAQEQIFGCAHLYTRLMYL